MKIIQRLVQEEVEIIGDPTKVFLGGFSQGCCLALATFLTQLKYPIGGVVGLSGMMAY